MTPTAWRAQFTEKDRMHNEHWEAYYSTLFTA
jgi:hypothetical protein